MKTPILTFPIYLVHQVLALAHYQLTKVRLRVQCVYNIHGTLLGSLDQTPDITEVAHTSISTPGTTGRTPAVFKVTSVHHATVFLYVNYICSHFPVTKKIVYFQWLLSTQLTALDMSLLSLLQEDHHPKEKC